MIDLKQQTIFKSGKGIAAGALIGLMLALVIGVAVTFTVVHDVTDKATATKTMANDSINVSLTTSNHSKFAGFGDGTDFTILISTLHIYNSTNCASEEFAYLTEYVIVNNDTAPYLNLTEVGTYVPNTKICAVYDYRASSYVPSSTARTILKLLPMLVAVVLLTAVTGFIS